MGKRKGKDNVSGHGRKKESRNGNNGNSRANKGGNAKDGKASSTDKNQTKKGDGGGSATREVERSRSMKYVDFILRAHQKHFVKTNNSFFSVRQTPHPTLS